MYEMNKESLETIITHARFVEDKDGNSVIRATLSSLMRELYVYTSEVNQKVLHEVLRNNASVGIGEIVVAIMGKEDAKDAGLCKMAEPCKTSVFLDEEYECIKGLIGDDGKRKVYEGEYIKDGHVERFQYYLKFDRAYVKKQELLYKAADYYKLDNPILYSPYSHKAVKLVYDEELYKEENALDFRFAENGLKVVLDKQLYWNMKEEVEEGKIYDAKLPYGGEVRYVFKFNKTKAGKYVFAVPLNNQTKVYDVRINEDGIELVLDRDMEDFTTLEVLEADKSSGTIKFLELNNQIFSNVIGYSGPITKRLISEADIEHAIAPFRDNEGVKCELSEGRGEIVGRYASKYRPDRLGRKLFRSIQRVYLAFRDYEMNRYVNDYINYVIEYLEYYYPEVEWVGER